MSSLNPLLKKPRDSHTWRVVVALVFTVALAVALAPNAEPAAAASGCTLTIDDAIPIGPEQSSVLMKFSSSIGDSLRVTFPQAANIVVISARRGPNDGPRTATMVLTTLRATAGQWLATAHGEKGECSGRVWIGRGAPKK